MKKETKTNFTKLTQKKGISLIVLIVTITSTYDEANKIDKNPPKNKTIDENKVVGCELFGVHFINLLLLIIYKL